MSALLRSARRLSACLLGLSVPFVVLGKGPAPGPWQEFVTPEGQSAAIPKEWIATPQGRFAHDLRIPNPVAAASGYRASMTRREYFDHLCAQESGSFIFKRIRDVDGFAMLRAIPGSTEDEQGSIWSQEAPGLQGKYPIQHRPETAAAGFVNPPWQTFEYVELPAANGVGFMRLANYLAYGKYGDVRYSTTPTSRYGVTWRGIRRERDRENLIAGYEWIILDLQTREVLAVLRNFSQTGNTTNRKGGIHWQNSRQCRVLREVNGTDLIRHEDTRWVARVLMPAVEPKVLQNIK